MGCQEQKDKAVELPSVDGLAAVDPLVGTGGHGHTFPGATMPFGMVQLSPDTRLEGWDGCSGYHNSDSIVYGFSHTHLSGTGVSDYGDLLLMPMVGKPLLENGAVDGPDAGYASRFDKASEKASPGRYSVHLKDYDIGVELTATDRCGLHRYRYPAVDTGFVIIDLNHRDQVIDAGFSLVNPNEIEGHRISHAWAEEQHFYFVARFSQPIAEHFIAEGSRKGWLAFDQVKNLDIEVGVSAVDVEGARKNLDALVKNNAFGEQAEQAWRKQLGKVSLKGGTVEQQRTFFTALYHTSIAPNLFSDVDGRYRGMDKKVHTLKKGKQYTVFSLWDTFRATHPLYTLLERERTGDFIRTFLRQAQEGEKLPVWELSGNETNCMIGYHSVSAIVDAYRSGIRGFDAEAILEAMVDAAEMDEFGLRTYQEQGFIGAADEAESVSRTLEYAYDDWCIAQMADALENDEVRDRFLKRAQSYRHLFDPETKFFRARMNGGWQPGFEPREVNFNFTEANAWQYSGFAPQDISGLIGLHGGPEALANHLDGLFTEPSATTGREQADITGLIGQYAHGNEPSHHMAYLYAYVGQPEKGEQRIHQIMNEMYSDQPDGLSGNEDCGQMSAWYVFSAMGFYPVTPGSGVFVLGTPSFPEFTLNLENGKTFQVLAPNVSEKNFYVQSVQLNGKPLERLFLRHGEILAGGTLEFELGDAPGPKWWNELPKQEMQGDKMLSAPVVEASAQTFENSLSVQFSSADAGVGFQWKEVDMTTADWALLEEGKANLTLEKSTRLMVRTVKDGRFSPEVGAEFYKIDGGRSIDLKSVYANEYAAAGEKALIDQLRGGPNFRTGRWQGFREDLEAVVDLGDSRPIATVHLSCLQDIKSWIWMPKEVAIDMSNDGKAWYSGMNFQAQTAEDEYGALVEDIGGSWPAGTEARYVRVRAKQFGLCPDWHLGAGGKTWIFADELLID